MSTSSFLFNSYPNRLLSLDCEKHYAKSVKFDQFKSKLLFKFMPTSLSNEEIQKLRSKLEVRKKTAPEQLCWMNLQSGRHGYPYCWCYTE